MSIAYNSVVLIMLNLLSVFVLFFFSAALYIISRERTRVRYP